MRSFETAFPKEFLKDYQAGTLAYRYRDIPCLKSPIDMAIYLSLLWRERPAVIFEIGSKHGGSARFFEDIAAMMQLGASVVSIDLDPPENAAGGTVRFLRGDVTDLGQVFSDNDLFAMPRPWLVIEDSAHSFEGCQAALRFFAEHLRTDEILVMEDGVLEDLDMGPRYNGGPNRAIAEFFTQHSDVYKVEESYCDMFGTNATYNPNAYLRRSGEAFLKT